MQRLTTCRVCKQKISKYNCKMCGNSVCENCYDKATGLCIVCKQGKSIRR